MYVKRKKYNKLILLVLAFSTIGQIILSLNQSLYNPFISFILALIILTCTIYIYQQYKISKDLIMLSRNPNTGLKSKYDLFQKETEIVQGERYLNYLRVENFDDIIEICGLSYSPMIQSIIIDKIQKTLPDVDIYEIKETTHLLVSRYPIDINIVLKEFEKPLEGHDNVETFHLKARLIRSEHSLYKNRQIHEILRIFDYAMLELEKSNQSTMIVTPELINRIEEEKYYQLHLETAIKKQEIVTYFQPKYNPKTNEIIGAEALSRWLREGKVISPGSYIYIAEATGLIYDIDMLSFENVCRFLSELSKKQLLKPHFKISTNLSAITLKNLKAKTLENIIESYQIDSKHLSVEITESIAVDYQQIRPLLNDIFELGISIEIDDFSAGNSSLTVLGFTQVSYVKIDQAILPKNTNNETNEILIYKGLIELLLKLGFKVVAEGVETIEQVNFVTSLGVEIIQGYYYSKPISKNEFNLQLK